MSDLFEAEVMGVESFATLEAVHKAKLLKEAKAVFMSVRFDDPTAPELPEKAKTLRDVLAPLAEYVKRDHPPLRNRNSAFLVLAQYLATPDMTPSPLPIVRIQLRVRETHPQAGMPSEIRATPFLASLLAHRSASNPLRDHFGDKLYAPRISQPGVAYSDFLTEGPAVFVGSCAGKAKTIEVDGAKRKEALVPVAIYGHWVPDVKVGMRWETGVSP